MLVKELVLFRYLTIDKYPESKLATNIYTNISLMQYFYSENYI